MIAGSGRVVAGSGGLIASSGVLVAEVGSCRLIDRHIAIYGRLVAGTGCRRVVHVAGTGMIVVTVSRRMLERVWSGCRVKVGQQGGYGGGSGGGEDMVGTGVSLNNGTGSSVGARG